jgi:Rps23 Pro-64 3,4-dihydroxylase Tpa1-like proline 4-hydroxylase
MRILQSDELLIKYSDVLSQNQINGLTQLVLENKEHFRDSDIFGGNHRLTGGTSFRKSKSLSVLQIDKFKNLFIDFIRAEFKTICESLNIEYFEIYKFDMQLTTHNDGDYYLWHRDISDEQTDPRMITFVYYFFVEPKMFSGGELILYPENRIPVSIVPENNSMIVFRPALLHEVKPVSCPGGNFENGRFAINGWVRKQKNTV